jgi:hypothetical protein
MQNKSTPEELNRAPLLQKLHGKNPYRVPEHYFETLSKQVENKLEIKPPAIRRISISRTAARFAAAASIVLFAGTAGWLYLHQTGAVQHEIYLTPEQISNSVYFDDLDLTLLKEEAARTTEVTSSDEIEKYLMEHDLSYLYE